MPVSAIDAVSPAFQHATQQLFKPFRFGQWVRLAVVVLIAREFIGGGWGGGVNMPQVGERRRPLFFSFDALDAFAGSTFQTLLPLILAGLAFGLAVLLFWVYAGSVYRFILLEAVLSDRCELEKGWHRWQLQGHSLFWWWIGSSLAFLMALAALLGIPAYLAAQAGVFREPDRHFGLLLGGGLGLFFLMISLIVVSALADLLARDFIVPVMALENVGVLEGWRRFLPLLRAEKMAYAGYILMKMVLTIGSTILIGIAQVVALLTLLIPMAVAGVVLFLTARAAGLHWTPSTITATALLALVAFGLIVYAVALVSAPAMVFFQAYAVHFFGPRYAPLAARLAQPAPPAEPLPSTAPP